VFSFNSTRQDARFTGFSLRWYEALMNDTKIIEGFWLSLKVALITGVLSAVLATFAAFVLVRYRRFLGRTIFSGMVNAPLVMPEVIIGLSLLLLAVGAQNLFGWPQRGMLTIILGHTLLGMAYGMVVIQSRLLEMNRSIEEAAMDLGARPHQVFFMHLVVIKRWRPSSPVRKSFTLLIKLVTSTVLIRLESQLHQVVLQVKLWC
jgi:putrescine transport system permease protein